MSAKRLSVLSPLCKFCSVANLKSKCLALRISQKGENRYSEQKQVLWKCMGLIVFDTL